MPVKQNVEATPVEETEETAQRPTPAFVQLSTDEEITQLRFNFTPVLKRDVARGLVVVAAAAANPPMLAAVAGIALVHSVVDRYNARNAE